MTEYPLFVALFDITKQRPIASILIRTEEEEKRLPAYIRHRDHGEGKIGIVRIPGNETIWAEVVKYHEVT